MQDNSISSSTSSFSKNSIISSSLFGNYLQTLWNGIYESLNIFKLFRLARKSQRIRTILKSGWLHYAVFGLFGVLWNGVYNHHLIHIPGFSGFLYRGVGWCVWGGAYGGFAFINYIRTRKMLNIVFSKQNIRENPPQQQQPGTRVMEVICGWLLFCNQSIVGWGLVTLFTGRPAIAISTQIIMRAWLISWSVFEPTLIRNKLDLTKRVQYCEKRWLWMLGFGLPVSAACAIVPEELYSIAWYSGVWMLTLQSFTSKPMKTPISYSTIDDQIDNSNVIELDTTTTPRRFNRSDNDDPRRFRIFGLAEYFTTYIIGKVVEWMFPRKKMN